MAGVKTGGPMVTLFGGRFLGGGGPCVETFFGGMFFGGRALVGAGPFVGFGAVVATVLASVFGWTSLVGPAEVFGVLEGLARELAVGVT